MLCYAYCIGMGRSNEEFYTSSPAMTITLLELDMATKSGNIPQGAINVKSMRDIAGLV